MRSTIFCNVKQAKEHLLNHGKVYIIKKCRETRGNVGIERVLNARCGSYFGKKKIGRVTMSYVTTMVSWEKMKRKIEPLVIQSGFATVDEWIGKVQELYGEKIGIGDCFDLWYAELTRNELQESKV